MPLGNVIFTDEARPVVGIQAMEIEMTQKSPKMGGVSVGVGVGARDMEELDASNQRHFR